MKDFFKELDENLARYEINSYGISITTLEEVFIKINEDLAPQDDQTSEVIKQELA